MLIEFGNRALQDLVSDNDHAAVTVTIFTFDRTQMSVCSEMRQHGSELIVGNASISSLLAGYAMGG